MFPLHGRRHIHCIPDAKLLKERLEQVERPDDPAFIHPDVWQAWTATKGASVEVATLGSSLAWHVNTSQMVISQGIRDLSGDFLIDL